MIFAQQRHNVLWVCTFGKASKTAQVAEQGRNLAPVAFELLLRARRNDQISDLWRQEAPQPAHALDFVDLVGDALLKFLFNFSTCFSSLA